MSPGETWIAEEPGRPPIRWYVASLSVGERKAVLTADLGYATARATVFVDRAVNSPHWRRSGDGE